jgi:antirestriction protein ArdC
MPEKTTAKDRLKEITESIETGIQELFQSDKYAEYLRTMSRFHKYSVNNTMLIYMQKPNATLVAGFNKWHDQFSRNVMKGEKGIKIIAPTPFKKKIEEAKLDPDTKAPLLDADGNAIMEEKEVKIPMYKVVSVFDVSQTDGKPLPVLASDLQGNVQNYEVFMEALKRSAPVPLAFEQMAANMDGYFFSDEQRIAIREGMSEVQTVAAAVHEIAHSKLHNEKLPEVKEQWKLVMVSDGGTKQDFYGGFDTREDAEVEAEKNNWQHVDENGFAWNLEVAEDTYTADFVKKSRNTEEVEAESVSFAVCAYYGIATGENSFGYIATWSKDKKLPELRASLETINKTASGLITDIDRNYAAICKERGIDQSKETEKQPGIDEWSEPATPQNAPEQPSVPSDDVSAYLPDGPSSESVVAAPKDSTEPVNTSASYKVDKPAQERGVEQPLAETAPDNGYMPDPAMTVEAMNAFGYTDDDMLPLSKERAIELFERDVPVYMLFEGNGAGMAFEPEDIQMHTGIFGVSREDWESVRETMPPAKTETEPERDQQFTEGPDNTFAIYQLRRDQGWQITDLPAWQSFSMTGFRLTVSNYDLVYTAPLTPGQSQEETLDKLYEQFNLQSSRRLHRPFALRQRHRCAETGRRGILPLRGFLRLRGAAVFSQAGKLPEKCGNGDGGRLRFMIDGIINNGPKQPTVAELGQQAKTGRSISLMDLAAAVHRERGEKKPSVLKQLKDHENKEKPIKTAPKKSAEREL